MYIFKKNLLLISLILISFLIVGCNAENAVEGNSSNGNSEEIIEMDVSNYNPSTHPWGDNVFEAWKEYVEEKTEGRVQVNVYHGGSLGGSSSVYQDVQGGMYDVGLAVANYFYDTGFFPYTIGSLPFAFTDAESTYDVLGEFGDKYAKEKLTDVVIMGATSTDA